MKKEIKAQKSPTTSRNGKNNADAAWPFDPDKVEAETLRLLGQPAEPVEPEPRKGWRVTAPDGKTFDFDDPRVLATAVLTTIRQRYGKRRG